MPNIICNINAIIIIIIIIIIILFICSVIYFIAIHQQYTQCTTQTQSHTRTNIAYKERQY